MSHLYQYTCVVNHDKGEAVIKTIASNEQAAKNNVVIAEGCPETAITSCTPTKTYY